MVYSKTKLSLLLSFFLLLLPSETFTSFAATIGPGESITGNRTLTSSGGGVFELGFFTPGASRKYYLGIWYRKLSEPTLVWVANREAPLPDDDSSAVRIGEDGNLVILRRSKVPVWSTNSSSTTNPNSTIVELLHSGNLVLRDRSNPDAVFWQSFDHPTDTLLPGGRLRFSGDSGTLASWRSSDDPAPGPFSLRLDDYTNAQYSLVWNGTRTYCTSGIWSGQIVEIFPEMHSNSLYNYSFVARGEEDYYLTYSVQNSTIITRLTMDITGQLKQLVWSERKGKWDLAWSQPREQCDVYSLCGSFSICNEKGPSTCSCLQGFQPRFLPDWNSRDWSGGCKRKTALSCGRGDAFRVLTGMKSPPNGRPSRAKSREECESDCRSSCSCSAFSFLVGCFIWETDLQNLQYLSDDDPRAVVINLRLAKSEVIESTSSSSTTRRRNRGLLVGATHKGKKKTCYTL
ncbi:hypothetical protein H6P81_007066 [Aristolochia fimbriata]|uniref:Uncharacterized protein n=1 Tax=Aristolochia fimbriata TaxID=158543 RepID=A0AAV7EZA3_ARIFI|nr:hypothetical protein H6P81_007066 [Aristolochia fimbriata]